jgi:hypothetical protein
MTGSRSDRPALTPEEERLVRRIGEVYRAPERSPAARVAFTAALEERLARRRRRGWKPLVALAAAGAALAFALLLEGDGTAPAPEAVPDAAPALQRLAEPASALSPEEVILAIATGAGADADSALPEDYLAIESLVLGG